MACAIVIITPTTLPTPTVGTPYSVTLTGDGGVPPYIFSISSGSLPPGLVLTQINDTQATITGVPTTNGTFNFTVQITDTQAPVCQPAGTQAYTLTIGGETRRRRRKSVGVPPEFSEDLYFNIQEFNNYVEYVMQNGLEQKNKLTILQSSE